jgi:hypothetical protein
MPVALVVTQEEWIRFPAGAARITAWGYAATSKGRLMRCTVDERETIN